MSEITNADDNNNDFEENQDNDEYDDGVEPMRGKNILKFGILGIFVVGVLYIFFFSGREKKEIAPEKQQIVKEESTASAPRGTVETNTDVSFEDLNTFTNQADTRPKVDTTRKIEEFETLFSEPDIPEIPEIGINMPENTLNLPDLSEIEQRIKEQKAREEEEKRLKIIEEKRRQEKEAEKAAAEAAAEAAVAAATAAREAANKINIPLDLPELPTLSNSNQQVDTGSSGKAEEPLITPNNPIIGGIELPSLPSTSGKTDGSTGGNSSGNVVAMPGVPSISDGSSGMASNMPGTPAIGNIELPTLPDATDSTKTNLVVEMPSLPTNTANPVTMPGGANTTGGSELAAAAEQSKNARRQQVLESRRQVGSILMSGNSTQSKEEDRGIVLRNADTITSLPTITNDFSASRIDDLSTTILQGKIIHVVLETALNTDLPGTLRAIVSRDVYAEVGDNILIPKGSRMIGTYAAEVARGQSRIAISWNRILRPDGVSINIDSQAADQFGRAGIVGDIDNRYKEIIANSLLTSLLSVGSVVMGELLSGSDGITEETDENGTTTLNTGKASDYALKQVGSDLVSNTQEMLQGIININPTISVPQGTRITVFVNQDLRIPPVSNTLGNK